MVVLTAIVLLVIIVSLSVALSTRSPRNAPDDLVVITPMVEKLALSLPNFTLDTLQCELFDDAEPQSDWYKSKLWSSSAFQPRSPQGKA